MEQSQYPYQGGRDCFPIQIFYEDTEVTKPYSFFYSTFHFSQFVFQTAFVFIVRLHCVVPFWQKTHSCMNLKYQDCNNLVYLNFTHPNKLIQFPGCENILYCNFIERN